MDRRASTPRRWPRLPLVVLALAGLPQAAHSAAAPSPAVEASSVRLAFVGTPRTDIALTGQPQESPPAEPAAEPPAPRVDRIAMTIGPISPGVQDASMGDADAPIRLRQPASILSIVGLPMAPPEAPTAAEPSVRPQPDEATPKEQMPPTNQPADAPGVSTAEPPSEPSTAEQPEDQGADAEPPAAEPDPDPAPRQPTDPLADAAAQPAAEPSAQPDPEPLPQQAAAAPAEIPQPQGGDSASLLLPPRTAARSEQVERIARQADRQTRRGFELASRGAYFAARAEFIGALRLVAQALDTQCQTDVHSQALAAGLVAISEAEDFVPSGSRLEADLNIAAVIEGHRTAVLRDANTQGLTPLSALRCYFTFAQEQLAAAAGSEVAGSMALHALGKLHAALAVQNAAGIKAAESKAVAFYQAALLVYPQNCMAANDFGVLLARCGHYRDAEAALKYALSISQQPTSWHNLAVVYSQLGAGGLAQQADRLALAARQADVARRKTIQDPSQQLVQWVDPNAFNQLGAGNPAAPRPMATAAQPTNVAPPSRPAPATQPSILGWLPWGAQEQRR